MEENINISINVDKLYQAFVTGVNAVVADALPKVKEVALQFVEGEAKLLKDLGIQYLSGQIDNEFLGERLKEVKEDFINALISIEQIVASKIEGLVNNLIDSFGSLLIATLFGLNLT